MAHEGHKDWYWGSLGLTVAPHFLHRVVVIHCLHPGGGNFGDFEVRDPLSPDPVDSWCQVGKLGRHGGYSSGK